MPQSTESAQGYAGYLARAAQRWPTRVGLRFERSAWTYQQLQAAVDAAADRLAAAGITPHSRVLLLIENSPGYLIAQFALARLGAAFVTPNPYWTDTEITHAISVSGATAAVHSPRFDWVAARLEVAVPIESLTNGTAEGVSRHRTVEWDTPAYIPFSSGTTGPPKGVLHSAESLCGAVEQLRHHLNLSEDDRLQVSLPLCHIFGTTISAAAISVGAEMTLFRRFDLDQALSHIRDARVTVWPMAGAVANRLAQRDDLRPEDFASLRFFMWGGSSVPVRLAEQIIARTGARFLCSYGMTEAMMVAFNPVSRPQDWRLDSPGYATAGTELRLADGGELEVRGPSVALGYSDGRSAAFGDDGWFRTGDRASIDPDGRLRIVDRIKDMIKVSGFQVSPTEVEDALLAHSDVDDVAVVGRPDDRTGETPVCFVVSRTAELSARDLTAWLTGRLSTYKLPSDYRFIDRLPRTPGGKLRRATLRAAAGSSADQSTNS